MKSAANAENQEIIATLRDVIARLRSRHYAATGMFSGGRGLTHAEVQTLGYLGRCGGSSSIGDIARFANVTLPGITQVVTKLEARGYVRRTHATDDRRKVMVSLTVRGRKTIVDHNEKVMEYFERFIADFTPKRRTLMLAVLKDLRRLLSEE